MADDPDRAAERPGHLEALLAESERRFQQYIDLPGVLFLSLDPSGCVAAVNDNGLKILGYRREELIGRNWFTTCLPPKDRAVVLELYSRLMEDEIEASDYYENSILKKDGSERVIAWNNAITRGPDGVITGTISSGDDITDRLQTEKRLKDAFEVINKSPAVTFLWQNREGWPVEFVSDNVLALLGYTAAEFMGGSVSYPEVIHPDDLERVTKEVAEFSAGARLDELAHGPYRVMAKDGTIKWLEDQTSARRDGDGTITHFRGIVLDITDRKNAEDALLKERNELRLALDKVNALSGLLPICASCKKIRDDKGYWNQIESYILEHSEAEFSHGICPECAKRLYPEYPIGE